MEQNEHVLWYPGHDWLLKDIVRAENCHLFDSKGNRYVDLESGVWCTSIGHGNRRIAQTIADQVADIGHTGFCYSNRILEAAALDILSLLGFVDGRCVFLCSGSEAVEYGVRIAQSIIKRPMLMTMTDSYFGAYGSASKRQEREWFSFDWMACCACPFSHECNDGCARWSSIPYDRIGGFLFEPGSSSGLVRFPPKKLIQSIVAAIRDNDGLVLVNEVTTGIGRTGTWFGHQHYSISPDLVAMGKGIGNGYPVSVTALAPSVMDRLGDRPVMYAQSHQNDPLGAAVVREVVRFIREEDLIERSRNTASTLMSELGRIKARTSKIKEIRGRGLMIAIEFIDDKRSSFTVRTHHELLRRGFIAGRRPGVSVLRLDPALTIDSEDIKEFLAALEDILTARRDD
jgi:acetylornithine aminotransferase